MARYNWASRPNKDQVRINLLSGEGPRKRGLFLPGYDLAANDGCLCVQTALSTGLIDASTEVVAVEKCANLINPIRSKLASLGVSHRIHGGELSTLRLSPEEQFDFAFFDFVGGMQKDVAFWLQNVFSKHIAEGAEICFTFHSSMRNNHFMKKCEISYLDPSHFISYEWARQRFAFGGDDLIRLFVKIVISCFVKDWMFETKEPMTYSDHFPMIALQFTNFKRRSHPVTDFPTITALMSLFKPTRGSASPKTTQQDIKMTIQDIETSLKKLSATLSVADKRTVNTLFGVIKEKLPKDQSSVADDDEADDDEDAAIALAVKRSQAAYKAHATRRANKAAAAAKRSQSALKAAATKRANKAA